MKKLVSLFKFCFKFMFQFITTGVLGSGVYKGKDIKEEDK